MSYLTELNTEYFVVDELLEEKAIAIEKRRIQNKIAFYGGQYWEYSNQDNLLIQDGFLNQNNFIETPSQTFLDMVDTTVLVKVSQAKTNSDYSRPFISINTINQISSQEKPILLIDIKDINLFFEKILNLQHKDKMNTLELIYDKFYGLFKSKKYSLANYILKNVIVENLETTCCLAFLTTTLPFKSQLPARQELFEIIQKYFNKKFPDRAKALLNGLN